MCLKAFDEGNGGGANDSSQVNWEDFNSNGQGDGIPLKTKEEQIPPPTNNNILPPKKEEGEQQDPILDYKGKSFDAKAQREALNNKWQEKFSKREAELMKELEFYKTYDPEKDTDGSLKVQSLVAQGIAEHKKTMDEALALQQARMEEMAFKREVEEHIQSVIDLDAKELSKLGLKTDPEKVRGIIENFQKAEPTITTLEVAVLANIPQIIEMLRSSSHKNSIPGSGQKINRDTKTPEQAINNIFDSVGGSWI